MAAVINGSFLANTTDASSYVSNAFTPAAGDLLVVMFAIAGTIDPAATCVSTGGTNGITFTAVKPPSGVWPTKSSNTNMLYAWVADQLVPSSPALMSATVTLPTDAGTGAIRMVARASGMTRVGLDAIKQCAVTAEGAHPAAPTVTFPAAVDTNNPTIFASMVTNTSLTVAPTGWTQRGSSGFSTPTTGGNYSTRDSGFSGTVITLGSTTLGAWCAMGIELDASVPGGGGGPTPFEGWGIPI